MFRLYFLHIKHLLRTLDFCNLGYCINKENLPIRREQLRTRMAAYPLLIFSQVLLQPLFVWLYWEHASRPLLLGWLAIFYAMHLLEIMRWYVHKDRLNTITECRYWHVTFTVFALITGLLWGGGSVLFFPDDVTGQSILICIMIGLTSGAVTINPVHPPALFFYVMGVMVPLIGRLFSEWEWHHQMLATMLSVFTVFILSTGWGLHRTFMLTLRQHFEKQKLVEQLSAQKAQTELARDQLAEANMELRKHEENLEAMVLERTSQLQRKTEELGIIQDSTVIALSSLAETRDNETGGHIRRTQHYVRLLALALQNHPRFQRFLTEENIELLFKLAPLHDIGKVGIPDHILLKPGKLTEAEFEIMKKHTLLGANAIAIAEDSSDLANHFLRVARQIAVGHHEKWDGSGYPFGLSGEDIPIPARLMALADVYDALLSRRVYKAAMSIDEATKIIIDGKGKRFDPDVVQAFIEQREKFIEVAERFHDQDSIA